MGDRGGILDLGSALSTCSLACGSVVCTIPGMRTQMRDPKQLPDALRISLLSVFIIYLTVMALAYFVFGRKLDDQDTFLEMVALDCVPLQCSLGRFAGGLITMNIFISTPTILFFVISVFEAAGQGSAFQTWSPANLACRAGLVFIMVYVGSLVPFVSNVFSLVSAAFGTFNCVIFPFLIYYTLQKKSPTSGHQQRPRHLELLLHAAVCVVGFVALIFGVMGALEALKEKLSKTPANHQVE